MRYNNELDLFKGNNAFKFYEKKDKVWEAKTWKTL